MRRNLMKTANIVQTLQRIECFIILSWISCQFLQSVTGVWTTGGVGASVVQSYEVAVESILSH